MSQQETSDVEGFEEDAENTETPVATRPVIQNAVWATLTLSNDETKTVLLARTLSEIVEDIFACMGGFPKRTGTSLFVLDSGEEPNIRTLDDADSLFAEIRHFADVHWIAGKTVNHNNRAVTPPSRNELFEYLSGRAGIDNFDNIEAWPHEPPLPATYYLPREIPDPPVGDDFSPLNYLLERLNPDTEEDLGLLKAMLLTLVWGGTPGTRPSFVLSSDHGRGSGKTTTAEVASHLVGGPIIFSAEDRDDRILSRLVSNEARNHRVVLYDNLKHPLSNAIIESTITSHTIQGHKLYHGQASRLNTLITIFTANTPELSTDLAQRSVHIKIGPPGYGGDFRPWAFDFVNHNRWVILAELMAILREPPIEEIQPENRSRWAGWQDAVLTRIANADAVAILIRERCGDFDADADTAAAIAAVVEQLLIDRGHSPPDIKAFLPGKVMLDVLVNANLLSSGSTQRSATTLVKQHAGSGDLVSLRPYKFGSSKIRGWLWRGPNSGDDAEIVEIPVEGDPS